MTKAIVQHVQACALHCTVHGMVRFLLYAGACKAIVHHVTPGHRRTNAYINAF